MRLRDIQQILRRHVGHLAARANVGRLVLERLVERIHDALREDAELKAAVNSRRRSGRRRTRRRPRKARLAKFRSAERSDHPAALDFGTTAAG
jgi:hypothetical protein